MLDLEIIVKSLQGQSSDSCGSVSGIIRGKSGKSDLEFEKPIYELEQKIEEIKNLSENVDVSDEVKTLEKKVSQLRERMSSSPILPAGS